MVEAQGPESLNETPEEKAAREKREQEAKDEALARKLQAEFQQESTRTSYYGYLSLSTSFSLLTKYYYYFFYVFCFVVRTVAIQRKSLLKILSLDCSPSELLAPMVMLSPLLSNRKSELSFVYVRTGSACGICRGWNCNGCTIAYNDEPLEFPEAGNIGIHWNLTEEEQVALETNWVTNSRKLFFVEAH